MHPVEQCSVVDKQVAQLSDVLEPAARLNESERCLQEGELLRWLVHEVRHAKSDLAKDLDLLVRERIPLRRVDVVQVRLQRLDRV